MFLRRSFRRNDSGNVGDFITVLFILVVLLVMSWSFYLSPKDATGELEGGQDIQNTLDAFDDLAESQNVSHDPLNEDHGIFDWIPGINILVDVGEAFGNFINFLASLFSFAGNLVVMFFNVASFNFSFLADLLWLRVLLMITVYAALITSAISVVFGG